MLRAALLVLSSLMAPAALAQAQGATQGAPNGAAPAPANAPAQPPASAPAQPATGAQAPATEIFKCRNAEGHWTYTNDRREGERQKCEVVTRQINIAPPPASVPTRPAPSARVNNFPRESTSERANRTASSREILEKELATEQAALEKARQELAAQEAVRSGDERNYARVLERLQPFKDNVETHEKNIEALRRELNNLR